MGEDATDTWLGRAIREAAAAAARDVERERRKAELPDEVSSVLMKGER